MKKRTGLLESGLASDGLAGLWMDWIAQTDGSMLAGTGGRRFNGLGRYAVQVQSEKVTTCGRWRGRGRGRECRVSGVGRNDRQVLGGEKMTEEVGSVAAGRPLLLQ